MSMCLCVYVSMCLCVYVPVCLYVYVFLCVGACVCVYVPTKIHVFSIRRHVKIIMNRVVLSYGKLSLLLCVCVRVCVVAFYVPLGIESDAYGKAARTRTKTC